jgi:hypothetical protein
MKAHQEIGRIFTKYIDAILVYPSIYETLVRRTREDAMDEKFVNKLRRGFAGETISEDVVACIDSTIDHNSRCGFVFTTEKVYCCKGILTKPIKVRYKDIQELMTTFAVKDSERYLIIRCKDGEEYEFRSTDFYKTPLRDCLFEIIQAVAKPTQSPELIMENRETPEYPKVDVSVGGIVYADVSNASTLYGENKFATLRGHGFAAERANHLYDVMTGKNAQIVGDNNAKNGPDRLVDGVNIQSKFCESGPKCVAECFNESGFRYYNKDGTPMQIEVPKDMYDSAVQAMKRRIERGEVDRVTNVNEAENFIRKSPFTYQQVKNIAKAGTVESITYDAANGAIIATSVFGITAAVSFAVSL